MKYSGILFGFQSEFGSIYNIPKEDYRCWVWRTSVVAEVSEKMIKIVFSWDSESYNLVLTELNAGYFTGKVIRSGEQVGNCYFYLFKKGNEFLLKGDYVEVGAGDHNCFLELRPIETDKG